MRRARKQWLAGYAGATPERQHRVWVAGRDKPHRCPNCWLNPWGYVKRTWRIRKWLPRKCGVCGAVTLATRPRVWYGKGWF